MCEFSSFITLAAEEPGQESKCEFEWMHHPIFYKHFEITNGSFFQIRIIQDREAEFGLEE